MPDPADDPAVLRAAEAALLELPQRVRDLLAVVLLEGRSAEAIADGNLISVTRAQQWIHDAQQRFADKLGLQLERAGLDREALARLLAETTLRAIATRAIRIARPTPPPESHPDPVEAPEPTSPAFVTKCPRCGHEFRDGRGQFAAFAKLASEGRIGLMLGCTACRLLFVPDVVERSTHRNAKERDPRGPSRLSQSKRDPP